MIVAAACTSCATATRLLVPHLLVAAVPPAANDEAVATVAWICTSCADLSVHPIDRPALLALVAGGAELFGGCRARTQPAISDLWDHRFPEPPKESTS